MSTLKTNLIQDLSGNTQYTCKAWVNFNGTGTVAIRASGNVSSITDNGVGDYTVNFITAMSDANYTTVGSCIGGNGSSAYYSLFGGFNAGTEITQNTASRRVTTSYVSSTSGGSLLQDFPQMHVAIFR